MVQLKKLITPALSTTRELPMTESRRLLQHFVAALAYRTQKALRGAEAAATRRHSSTRSTRRSSGFTRC